ncbi:MAG: hypothetical protein AB3N16_15110 [Flavobacteriaceae bacterium]
MGFDINPISLTFKKNRDLNKRISQDFVLQPRHTPKSSISYWTDNDWVSIVRPTSSDRDYQAVINSSKANLLPAGQHVAKGTFRYKYTVGGIIRRTQEETITINLTVFNTVKLSVTPSFLAYEHTIGQSVPGNKFLSLKSENNWVLQKDQAWIVLSRTTGSGNSSISVGVDPSGLSSGVYQGAVLVDDGYDKETVSVTLTIKGENTADDYLLARPDTLEYVEIFQEPPSSHRKLVVESSEDYTLSANVPWVSLPGTVQPAGKKSHLVAMVNTEALHYGTHQGTITVESNYSTITVQVLLSINASDLSGVDSDQLYFAEDRNKILFSNTMANSELVLEFLTRSTEKEYFYTKVVSFFRGVASSVLGQEAKNIIVPQTDLINLSTRCFVPVVPLQMTITAYDKKVGSTQRTKRDTLTNVRVLTGKSPIQEDWLCNMPKQVYVPQDAVLSFTFLANTPPESIELKRSKTAIVNVPPLDGGIYTCMVKLADFNLEPGNVVDIYCAAHIVTVNVLPIEPEHTKILWLNEWNCPEIFSCRGDLTIEHETSQDLAKYAFEGNEHSEVIDVENPITYRLYTGFLFSRPEVEWLHSILRARKIWLQVDGQWVEVVRDFKKLPFYQTRNYLDAYQLKFKKAVI